MKLSLWIGFHLIVYGSIVYANTGASGHHHWATLDRWIGLQLHVCGSVVLSWTESPRSCIHKIIMSFQHLPSHKRLSLTLSYAQRHPPMNLLFDNWIHQGLH